MKPKYLIAPFLVFALTLSACGDDDDGVSSDLQPYADAIAASVLDDNDESFELSDDEAQCIGETSAQVVGLDRLEEIGTPEEVVEATEEDLSGLDLDDDEIGEVVDGYFDCTDGLVDRFREGIAADADLSDSEKECVEDLIDDEFARELIQGALSGDEEAFFEVFGELAACEDDTEG